MMFKPVMTFAEMKYCMDSIARKLKILKKHNDAYTTELKFTKWYDKFFKITKKKFITDKITSSFVADC